MLVWIFRLKVGILIHNKDINVTQGVSLTMLPSLLPTMVL